MKKVSIVVLVLAVVGVAAFFLFFRSGVAKSSGYDFVELYRGNLENVISCTGTLNPVSTVDVGTQVSGTIDTVMVDFNDIVKKGQVLAVLDTAILSSTVSDAKAGVLKAEAELEQVSMEFNRYSQLYEKGLATEQEYIVAKTNLKSSQASLQTSKSTLNRAETNLRYAVVLSPIDGTVIHRNVEQGQTVAASLSTPTLFTIAEDLSEMEIHAQVDESDIGQVKSGQKVRFTVQAYMEKTFTGTVRQIWLQPETVSNVVNYTVVIDASNPDGLLLPGMTATVDFIVEHKEDILLLPNAAIRFQPSQEMLTAFKNSRSDEEKAKMRERMQEMAASGQSMSPPESGGMSENMAMLWYLGEDNKLNMVRVQTGSTDGKVTELVIGDGIKEGMRFISGLNSGESSQATNNNRSQGGGPGFGPPF